ncbi:MAG TPA: zf-HC2 domain-containing protein [Longimicrobium sp.]|jgi:anti-sigma factor RsiW|uniref:zf-HC2 domain-containing protein n=1 Tax=Longimicrobium sp. TaxID=2029185 RepID=UPI002EDAA7BA
MTHERTLELLDDYVGGELPAPDEREVRRHLMQCDDCRAEERALLALLDEAAALPTEIQPTRDLWSEIAPRLQPRDTVALPAEVPMIGPRQTRRVPWWMQAAAAVLLTVGTSVATLMVAGDRTQAPVAIAPVQRQAPVQAPARTDAALASFRPAEEEYQAAIGDLQKLLDTQRSRMSPRTAATLEANLRVIDQAIQESRAALAADPNSRELARMLSASYDAKLGVLRRAVLM